MLTIKQHVLVNEKIEEFYENENNPQKQAVIAAELSEEYPDYNTGYILKMIMLSKDDDTEKYKAVLNSVTDKKTLNLSLSYPYDVLDTDQPGFSEVKAQIFTNFLKRRAEYLESDYAKSLNKILYLKELFGIYDSLKDAENLLETTKKLITQDFNYVLIKRYFEGNGEAPHRKMMNDYYREYQKVMSEWNNTIEEKMEVFSKVYSEIKYSSASLKITEIQDWERFANSYIPKLIRAENKLEFYELLVEMVHKIGDNHNNLSFPEDIEREFCNPGLSLSFIKDKFFVRSDLVYKGVNISAGDELVKINDADTDEYIEENKNKYPLVKHYHFLPKLSAFYTMSSELLSFQNDRKLKADFKKTDNSIYSVEFSSENESKKQEKTTVAGQNKMKFEMIENDILLIEISAFWGGDVYADFIENMKKYDASAIKGIIFDVRRNAGGNSGFGDRIFSHFTTEEVKNYFMTYTKVHIPIHSLDGIEDIKLFDHVLIKPSQDMRINCPVAVLTTPYTGSAAEGFVFLFKYYKRGRVIGLPTYGSTGNPLFSLLKGGGTLRVNLNVSLYYTCKGIQPDDYVEKTITDLMNGNDPQLKQAIKYLNEFRC